MAPSTARTKFLVSQSPRRTAAKPTGLSPSGSKDDSRNLEASPFPLGSVLQPRRGNDLQHLKIVSKF